MRVRNFYPRQAAKKLTGKNLAKLNAGDRAALRFFAKKGRKMGVNLEIVKVDCRDIEAMTPEQAAAVCQNVTTKLLSPRSRNTPSNCPEQSVSDSP